MNTHPMLEGGGSQEGDGARGSVASRIASFAFGALVAGMVATPLFPAGGSQRAALAVLVVMSLFVCATADAFVTHGNCAISAAAAVVVVTFFVEVIGSSTGFPFGEYDYGDALAPQVAGVPLAVAFAWAGITLVAHGTFAALAPNTLIRVVLMAGAITAWDAFLDPQMVGEGYWTWSETSSAYRGIPLVNYLGWFATACVTSLITLRMFGEPREVRAISRGVYATLALLSTVGFTFFFEDLVVAFVGGLTMGAGVIVSFGARRRRSP
ncbi:MAG: carotenoid biosynthesis protein [Acidimicrobiia bacterium]